MGTMDMGNMERCWKDPLFGKTIRYFTTDEIEMVLLDVHTCDMFRLVCIKSGFEYNLSRVMWILAQRNMQRIEETSLEN